MGASASLCALCVCAFLDSVFFCLLSLIRVCLLVFLSYFIINIINACLYPKEREREEKGIDLGQWGNGGGF